MEIGGTDPKPYAFFAALSRSPIAAGASRHARRASPASPTHIATLQGLDRTERFAAGLGPLPA